MESHRREAVFVEMGGRGELGDVVEIDATCCRGEGGGPGESISAETVAPLHVHFGAWVAIGTRAYPWWFGEFEDTSVPIVE